MKTNKYNPKIRYKRQIILKDIGEEGQEKLENARVLIVGVGGLGSPVALYLAAAGIGTIGLADGDCVDLSNLQRQVIHREETLGVPKVDSAKESLLKLNSDVNINTYYYKIDENNIKNIITEYDVVVSTTDNIETRYLLNDMCIKYNVPLVEGSIYNFEGQVMTIIPNQSACYRCVYPEYKEDRDEEIGVISMLPGVIGTLQACEVLKCVLNIGKLLKNQILYYNALTAEFRKMKIEKDENCKCCNI